MTAEPYARSSEASRRGRTSAGDALAVLEDALAAPTPGRQLQWLKGVSAALDAFIARLDSQASSDLADDSLLAEIGRDHPRFQPHIERLHAEHRDLRSSATSLRSQIAATADTRDADVDTADIRDRLAAITRDYRRHRAHEADLVYEAVTVDLGGGD